VEVLVFAGEWMGAYRERWDFISTDSDDRPSLAAGAVTEIDTNH